MFSYDELVAYRKRYYFKLDNDTGERKLFDRNMSDFISNNPDYDTILAALGIMNTLGSVESDFGSFNKAPYKTSEEKIAWEKEQVVLLQESLYKTLSSGSYHIHNNFSEMFKTGFIERNFFQDLSSPEKYPDYRIKQANCLMNYILDSHGKKLISYDIQKQIVGTDHIIDFKFNTREKTFSEKLNPNNPQYTQPKKAQQLSPEAQVKRRAFAEKLVTYYLATETDEMYQERVNSEDKNMKFAANAINNSKDISLKEKDFAKLMRLLLASKNISLDGQTDYFEKIISQPDITNALLDIKKGGKYDRVKLEAEKNMQEGKLFNGKKLGHIETKGELGLRCANTEIQKNPNFIEKAKKFVSTRSKFSVKEFKDVNALSAVARTQGKLPSYTENTNGTFEFNSGEEITR